VRGSLKMQDPNNRHLGTIAQLCQASLQLRHVSTIRKKLVKQHCLPHMSSQYGERWPTSSWRSVGEFEPPLQISTGFTFGSITARHSVVGISQTLQRW